MSEINKQIALEIEKNDKDKYLAGVDIILKLLDNIIKEPGNQKYRTIRMENKVIRDKLLPLSGAKELLVNIGFVENNSDLVLPPTVLIAKVRNYRELIAKRLYEYDQNNQLPSSLETATKGSFNEKKLRKSYIPKKSFLERTSFPRILFTNNKLLLGIETTSDMVMQYNDPELLAAGRSLIPIERLKLTALRNLRDMQKAFKAGKYPAAEPNIEDLLLVELVNWFHTEFFEWVNTLPCKICGKEEISRSNTVENRVTVEIGFCCNKETKFYRYNDVCLLVQTRRGRCGEYANCFTFLCRCLNYDARFVSSQFDHVWTEVYSVGQKRWIHVDPSENIVDAPLMYQHGWQRKIDYVMAYSCDDIQDVTWRYSSNHKDTLALRKECTEKELIETILKIRKKRQINISDARNKYLKKRNLSELLDLMVERQPTEDEKRGRSSGNLSWRQKRGEQNCDNFFVFEANTEEAKNKQFNIRYSCVTDKYERFLKDDKNDKQIIDTYKGWHSCQYTSRSIFRKVERDWKMAYLSREEGSSSAEIIWRFNFSKSNLTVKNYSLNFETKTYEDGTINFSVVPPDGPKTIIGSSEFSIIAKLSGGKGDLAWQHTQLFRQSLNSKDYPFELNIIFT